MKVALIQLAYQDDLPLEIRRAAVVHRLRQLAGDADLVVLPELWSAGAFTPRRWSDCAEPVDGPTGTALAETARELGCVVHGGSIVERAGDRLHNTALLFGPDGDRLAAYRKIHTFGAAGLERELIVPGEAPCVVELPLRAGGTVRTGVSTCYDLRFPELFRVQARAEVAVQLVSASWPAARAEAWTLLLRARAMENQTFVLGCGAAGWSGRTAMAGSSVVIGPDGRVVAAAPGSDDAQDAAPEHVLTADLDLDEIARVREEFPVLPDRRLERC